MIVTQTDRVDKLLKQKKALSVSEQTLSTATMSTLSSYSDMKIDLKEAALSGLNLKGKEELLMRLIAKEMAASLLNGYSNDKDGDAEQDDDSKCGSEMCGSVTSELAKLNLDVDGIAAMVLNSVDKNMFPQEMQGGEEGHDLNIEAYTSQDYSDELTTSGVSNAALSRAGTLRTMSTNSSGGLSQLSNQTGGQETPMDIWHPDFWNADVKNEDEIGDEVNDSMGPLQLRSVKGEQSTERTTSTPGGSSGDSGGTGGASGRSLHDFIHDLKEIHSSSDSDGDDCSVLSDISGLTGVFPDYSADRKKSDDGEAVTAAETASSASQSKSNGVKSRSSLSQEPSTQYSSSVAGTGSSARRKRKKRIVSYTVNFSTVHVRYYERILGDNPSCTNGPPLGIGWNFIEKGKKKVDDWEMERGRLRSTSELVLNRRQREKIIESLGYKEKDIAAAVRELNKARYQRRQTVNNLGAQKMEEAVENAKRKMKKLLFMERKHQSLSLASQSATSVATLQQQRLQI